MRNVLKYLIIIVVAYVALSYFLQKTKMLQGFKNTTLANEPNLKINAKFWFSNLFNPAIGDFVSYKYEDSLIGEHTRVSKLCALENDILEIKQGIVYVNNKNIDENTQLLHHYKLSNSEYKKIKNFEKLSNGYQDFAIDNYNFCVTLNDLVAEKHGFSNKRIKEEVGQPNNYIKEIFNKKWNKDNFGPIKIPLGKVFVLGDNRDNSDDSRYIGLIDYTNINGKLVFTQK